MDALFQFQVLQQVAAAFMLKLRFVPSFWFDKACIDQENIADGLASCLHN